RSLLVSLRRADPKAVPEHSHFIPAVLVPITGDGNVARIAQSDRHVASIVFAASIQIQIKHALTEDPHCRLAIPIPISGDRNIAGGAELEGSVPRVVSVVAVQIQIKRGG